MSIADSAYIPAAPKLTTNSRDAPPELLWCAKEISSHHPDSEIACETCAEVWKRAGCKESWDIVCRFIEYYVALQDFTHEFEWAFLATASAHMHKFQTITLDWQLHFELVNFDKHWNSMLWHLYTRLRGQEKSPRTRLLISIFQPKPQPERFEDEGKTIVSIVRYINTASYLFQAATTKGDISEICSPSASDQALVGETVCRTLNESHSHIESREFPNMEDVSHM
jgi:hypothetical protein